MTGVEEIAWATGFYDGEGSVSCTSNNGNPNTRIQLSVGQRNDRKTGKIAGTLVKFHKVVGRGHIYRKTRVGKEINQHQFVVCRAVDVEYVVSLLWKNLSLQKKRQAERAFSLYNKGGSDLGFRSKRRVIRCPM